MAYLTFDEYKQFNFQEIDEASFDKVLMRATMAIDSVTRFYLVKNAELIEQWSDWMKEQFKQAVGLQIEYIAKTGIETASDAREANTISSSTIGDTSVQKSTSNNSSSDTELYLSPDVMSILGALGLLYKGVIYVR
ncbi:hypothetical protein EFL35_01535 [Weissella paramesenteroides]|uniref:hypothetical protein n=1 Tax=Weissella paramesenteroides TaxID=1249 RepID=UPI00223B96F1|nr:hypothetical protein [Weissella paramesenteroides]MCS9983680.1 hypothetical protein [Weissella paramesenteroides]MCS9997957.1 hypothetical protein [Weissella paramesenteroides]MCT0260175.1 hypothetical protein [Weissella paramesenteroides]